MKKFFIATLMLTLIQPTVSFAHEGHDHDAPTTVKAPKGGIVKSLDEAHVEVVSKGKDIKIHVYNKDLTPASAADFNIEASAQLPRTKNESKITLTSQGNTFEGSYDPKGAHRFTLKLSITHAKTSRTDKMTFTIEPRK